MKTPEEQTAATNMAAAETANGIPNSNAAAPNAPNGIGKEEFVVKNQRRLALLDKEYDGGGLTNEEEAELARLEGEVDRYLDALPPTTEQMFAHWKDMARRSGKFVRYNECIPLGRTPR